MQALLRSSLHSVRLRPAILAPLRAARSRRRHGKPVCDCPTSPKRDAPAAPVAAPAFDRTGLVASASRSRASAVASAVDVNHHLLEQRAIGCGAVLRTCAMQPLSINPEPLLTGIPDCQSPGSCRAVPDCGSLSNSRGAPEPREPHRDRVRFAPRPWPRFSRPPTGSANHRTCLRSRRHPSRRRARAHPSSHERSCSNAAPDRLGVALTRIHRRRLSMSTWPCAPRLSRARQRLRRSLRTSRCRAAASCAAVPAEPACTSFGRTVRVSRRSAAAQSPRRLPLPRVSGVDSTNQNAGGKCPSDRLRGSVLTPHASLMQDVPCLLLSGPFGAICGQAVPRGCWTERVSHRYTPIAIIRTPRGPARPPAIHGRYAFEPSGNPTDMRTNTPWSPRDTPPACTNSDRIESRNNRRVRAAARLALANAFHSRSAFRTSGLASKRPFW